MPTEQKEIKNLSYNEAVNELEGIVALMQADDCDIDRLAAYTRRSLELLRHCKQKLTSTDEEIKRCLEELS